MPQILNPKVSVIVPAYNSEDFIHDCIVSISKQSYDNTEIIVINDGSIDKTRDIVSKVQDSDDRVVLLDIENSGPANARNIGLEQCTGDLVLFADADDIVLDETLERFVNEFNRTKADMIFSYTKKVFDNGQEIYDTYVKKELSNIDWSRPDFLRRRMVGMVGEELKNSTKTDAFNTPWGKLFNANFLKKNNLKFKNRSQIGMEDVLFCIESILRATKVSYINYCTYSYRQINDLSVSRVDTKDFWHKSKNLCQEMERLINAEEAIFQKALSNRVFLLSINVLLSITNPRVNKSKYERQSEIQAFLADEYYANRIRKVQVKYLPVHFKVLKIACEKKMGRVVYYLALMMRKLRV